jgi:hypothetical protein
MARITPYLSILTLNVNGLNCPSKGTFWQTGLKGKIQHFVVFKKPILLIEVNSGLGSKAGRRLTKPVAPPIGRSSNTYTRQSRLQNYIVQMSKEGHAILIKAEYIKKK